jgi:hypothetical protein
MPRHATRTSFKPGKEHPMYGKFGKEHTMFGKHINVCEKNNMWQGNNVGISALHGWMTRHKPKPEVCEICKIKPPYDLANISGKYKRDINDFQWICRRCHMIQDGRLDKIRNKKIGRWSNS